MSIDRARQLRKSMTPFEARLWLAVRALRGQGLHFRRQSPRDGYVVDFLCIRARLIVELDGDQHGHERQAAHDARRDAHFATAGFLTLRFWNAELRDNFDGVVETIFRTAMDRQRAFDEALRGKAPPLPSPRGGEGSG